MSTATNGAATEAAFGAIARATENAGPVVVDAATATAAVGQAGEKVQEAGKVWIEASKTVAGLSLDAYDASVRAYLDYAEGIAAASRAAWAVELAQHNTKIVSELAANYSSVARDLFNK